MTDRRFETAALALADAGYAPFPCRSRRKEPSSQNGFKDASRNERDLLHFWERYPDANIGVACDASGISVLDIDTKHGADPKEVVAELGLENHPAWVQTGEAPEQSEKYPNSLVGERGVQLYFRGKLPTGDSTIPGVEIRGEGAYVIAPPSVHPSGVPYEGDLPPVAELPPIPKQVAKIAPQNGVGPREVGDVIEQGGRHEALLSLGGTIRRRGAGEGELREYLRAANQERCRPPLPEDGEDGWARLIPSLMRKEPAPPPRTESDRTHRTVAANPHDKRDPAFAPPTERSPNATERSAPDLAFEPAILDRFGEMMDKLGLIGERGVAASTYLTHISRLTRKPAREVVKGDSSTGKSFACECALTAAAPEELYVRTQTSPLALFYSERDFRHTTIVFYEANKLGDDDDPLANVLRTLLSEGRLAYEVTDPRSHSTKYLEQEGPVAFITTTCKPRLDAEIETRILSLHSNNSDEQTRLVVRSIIEEATATPAKPDLSNWHEFDRWLRDGPREVAIPWAKALASFDLSGPPRLRRDIQNFLALVRAHALLHRATRGLDAAGRIPASFDDYEAVSQLLSEAMAIATDKAVRRGTREVVESVAKLLEAGEQGITLKAAARGAGRSPSTTHTDVHDALERGYLVNRSENPNRFDLVIGDPLPEHEELLPSRDELQAAHEGAFGTVRQPFAPPTERGNPVPEPKIGKRSVRSVNTGDGGADGHYQLTEAEYAERYRQKTEGAA